MPPLPVSITALNNLLDNFKLRLYRTLIPTQVLADFAINPRTWKNPTRQTLVNLIAAPGQNLVRLVAWYGDDPENEFFLELADNALNGIDLHFFIASDPTGPRFTTDMDDQGRQTLFGTVHRNLDAEEKAMHAGLAPGQTSRGLRCSQIVFNQMDSFLDC